LSPQKTALKILAVLLLLTASCTNSNSWNYDAIASGSPAFDSTRITHFSPSGYPPWKIEILKNQEKVEIFLSLIQYQLHPLDDAPHRINILLSVKDESNLTVRSIEDTVPLFEGKMRLRFSDTLATEFIQSLQEGKKVSILVDGLEETIEPDFFKEIFSKLDSISPRWLNIQNPLE
jgi:hypothetical protein